MLHATRKQYIGMGVFSFILIALTCAQYIRPLIKQPIWNGASLWIPLSLACLALAVEGVSLLSYGLSLPPGDDEAQYPPNAAVYLAANLFNLGSVIVLDIAFVWPTLQGTELKWVPFTPLFCWGTLNILLLALFGSSIYQGFKAEAERSQTRAHGKITMSARRRR